MPHKLLILFFILFFSGCASTPKSASTSEATILNIDMLTLLPIVTDTPLSPESRKKILKNAHDNLTLDFALKGYALEKVENFSEKKTITSEDVAKMKVDDLAELGPEESRYLLLCVLKQLDSYFLPVGENATAGIYALIVDKKQKRIIWRNEDKGGVSTGMFAGPLFLGDQVIALTIMLAIDDENVAIYSAIRNLFSTIPEKPMN